MAVSQRRSRIRSGSSLGYDDRIGHRDVEFINPYPYMSSVEARVHLELERRRVPFSWRHFDADLAPHLKELMPAWTPEFTLKEYQTVIVVQGGYFGTLPGVLDTLSVATVLLEMDGWKVVTLWEQDILRDLDGVLKKALPWISSPPVTGPPRMPPLGVPDFMQRRRQQLSSYALRRAYYKLEDRRDSTRDSGRKRRRLRRERTRRLRTRESR